METLFKGCDSLRIVQYGSFGEAGGLISLFKRLADDLGWQPGDQLDAYPHNSIYFGAMVGEEVAGGLQLVIANGVDPLPSHHVWPEIDLADRTDVAHAAIMALKPEYRAIPGLFTALTVEMWRYCALSGIAEIWHEATPPTLRVYRRIGWPLEITGPLRPHWGEDCFLCKMTTAAVAGNLVIKALRSQTHRETLAALIRPTATVLTITTPTSARSRYVSPHAPSDTLTGALSAAA